MQNSYYATMDIKGEILILASVRGLLGWEPGTGLKATLDSTCGTLVLKETKGKKGVVTRLDELSRITLPRLTRDTLGWLYIDPGDSIKLEVCKWTKTVTLSLHEKLKYICLFCGRPDSVADIYNLHEKGVCQHCINEILRDFKQPLIQ